MKLHHFLLGSCLMIAMNGTAQENKVLNSDEEKKVIENLTKRSESTDSLIWKKGGNFGLNVTQTYLDNWASGGQSSVATTALINLFANYAKGNNTWDNTLDMAYGILRQGDAGQWIKTDDRVDFSSKYGRKASKNWFYSGLFNFRSQFAPGYQIADGREIRTIQVGEESIDARISDFLSPGYSLFALGMDYKPNDKLTVFIAPVTVKTTYVFNQDLADAGAFGVEAAEFNELGEKISDGENIRNELGGYLKVMYKTPLMENVDFQTKLDLFSNYQNNPQNIDVNWEVLLTMKVNKFLQTSISTQLLYDDDVDVIRGTREVNGEEVNDIGPGTQFKQVLAIGLSYKF